MIEIENNKSSSKEQVIRLKRNRNISKEDRKIYEAADKDYAEFQRAVYRAEGGK